MPRATIAADIADANCAGLVSDTILARHASCTTSLNVSAKISSCGWECVAKATAEATTRSRLGRMLLLLSIRNPTDAGTSSAENISSVCGFASSMTVNASLVRPVT